MSFLNAMWKHIWLLMTWRHDGRGLPEQMFGVALFAMIYYAARLLTIPDIGEATWLDIGLILGTPAIMVLMVGPQLACGLMLINTIVVTALGILPMQFPAFKSQIDLAISIWSISTGIALLIRASQRKSTT